VLSGHQAEAEGVSQSPVSSPNNDTLQKILLSKQALQKKLSEDEKDLKKEKTEAGQEAIRSEIQEISSRIQDLDSDFESIVSGVDPAEFSVVTENVDWQQELRDLLSPILEEMKRMTARPREMEALRKQVALYRKRINLTDNAIKNIQQHIDGADSEAMKQELKPLILSRQQRYDELKARLAAAQQQPTEKEQKKVSILSSIRAIFREFFKSRGLNFVLALSAFLLFFF
jgi:predicted  nucleic acid-binding Zn-ribbon protein